MNRIRSHSKKDTDKAIDEMEQEIFNFREKFYDDLKNSPQDRQLYKLTKPQNVHSEKMIGTNRRSIDNKQFSKLQTIT